MKFSERDELRRAILRFQELSVPHKLLELLALIDEQNAIIEDVRRGEVTPVQVEQLHVPYAN